MASKVILLALVSYFVCCQAHNPRARYISDYDKEYAAVDDRSAYDKNRNINEEYGTSDGKKVSFSNKNKNDESALTNEETLKRGPTISNGPYYGKGYGYGHGYGSPSYYEGGLEYSKKSGDVRKSSDGSTAYDASDIKAERNARTAADTGKGYRYLKGASSKVNDDVYDGYGYPHYRKPYAY